MEAIFPQRFLNCMIRLLLSLFYWQILYLFKISQIIHILCPRVVAIRAHLFLLPITVQYRLQYGRKWCSSNSRPNQYSMTCSKNVTCRCSKWAINVNLIMMIFVNSNMAISYILCVQVIQMSQVTTCLNICWPFINQDYLRVSFVNIKRYIKI